MTLQDIFRQSGYKEEGLVIRELANGSLIDEHARRINMKPEDFREHLKRLMKHVH